MEKGIDSCVGVMCSSNNCGKKCVYRTRIRTTGQGLDAFARHWTYETVFTLVHVESQENFFINSLGFYHCISDLFGQKEQRQIASI